MTLEEKYVELNEKYDELDKLYNEAEEKYNFLYNTFLDIKGELEIITAECGETLYKVTWGAEEESHNKVVSAVCGRHAFLLVSRKFKLSDYWIKSSLINIERLG